MARTIIPEAKLDAAWLDFYRNPDPRPRELGKLARKHGLTLKALRAQMDRDGWHLAVRRISAARRSEDGARGVALSRRRALRTLARVLPLLRSTKVDARTLRSLSVAAHHAGYTLINLYTVGAWLSEARRDLALTEAGKPGTDAHPWGERRPRLPTLPLWHRPKARPMPPRPQAGVRS